MRLFLCVWAGVITLFCANVQAVERAVPYSKEQTILSFAPLVKHTAPAVVNIYASKTVKVRNVSPFLSDPLFRYFFGNIEGMTSQPKEKVENSLGSGVIIRPDGLIATSEHVIKDSTDIKVVLSDRREFAANIVLSDPRADLILLKIDTKGEELPHLALQDSDALEVGDMVLAIGNPFGVGQTVTNGIVSALARTAVGVSDFEFFIQTDAAINPGNSGGALIDMQGNLVGINTAIFTRSGGSHGIGFAIPSNMLSTVVDSYESEGKILRPWLGATTQDITSEIAESLGLDAPKGVLVKTIYPDSAAEKAGLALGDVILKVGNREVFNSQGLRYHVLTSKLGEKVPFILLRKNQELTLHVNMELPEENPPRNVAILKGHHPFRGATVANLSPALSAEIGVQDVSGVIILKASDQPILRRFRLHAGDIVKSVNGEKIITVKQLVTLLSKRVHAWKIDIKRGRKLITLNVTP